MCPFVFLFFLRIRRPPRSTRTDTLFPYTTLFRSSLADAASALMDLRTSLAGTNAPSRSPDRKPPAADGDFADIEQQMLAKQAVGQGESTSCPPLSTFPARNGAGQRASKLGAKAQKAKNKKAQPQPKDRKSTRLNSSH